MRLLWGSTWQHFPRVFRCLRKSEGFHRTAWWLAKEPAQVHHFSSTDVHLKQDFPLSILAQNGHGEGGTNVLARTVPLVEKRIWGNKEQASSIWTKTMGIRSTQIGIKPWLIYLFLVVVISAAQQIFLVFCLPAHSRDAFPHPVWSRVEPHD